MIGRRPRGLKSYGRLTNSAASSLLLKMTSILKAQKANALKADAKGKGKRKADDMDVDEVAAPTPKRRNKQRVLLLSSRGITHRMRHLMNDIEALLPHVKKGVFHYYFHSLQNI